jgi:hypothetical protein
MAKMTQLTVSCQNHPGTLAEIAGILCKANVNILAFNAGSAGSMGYVQFIVDHPSRAKRKLEEKGFSCYEERVVYLTVPNVPGALFRLASKLAARDINVGAGYQTTVKGGSGKASVVLAVSDLAVADRVR